MGLLRSETQPRRNSLARIMGVLALAYTIGLRPPSADDSRYAGYLHPHHALNSCGVRAGYMHLYMAGENLPNNTQACGQGIDGSQPWIANWNYPCGTSVLAVNPRNGRMTRAYTTDRSDTTIGYPGYIGDMTPAVAEALEFDSGGPIVLMPSLSCYTR